MLPLAKLSSLVPISRLLAGTFLTLARSRTDVHPSRLSFIMPIGISSTYKGCSEWSSCQSTNFSFVSFERCPASPTTFLIQPLLHSFKMRFFSALPFVALFAGAVFAAPSTGDAELVVRNKSYRSVPTICADLHTKLQAPCGQLSAYFLAPILRVIN